MATPEVSAWDSWCTSHLRIVLLGGRNSGKSSVGNLILGHEEFVTKERTSCSRRLGVVGGRWLTVVDTPGWWCDFSARDTPELVKREIISSVSLCSPGPHVFLIVIKASSAFSARRRRAVEEHVALLGESVWHHCMVVFTSADRFDLTEASELLQSRTEALSWLSEKCGHRIHKIDLGDEAVVPKLLEKIQEVVTANGNKVFEMQEKVLLAAEEEKRRVEEKAQQRYLRVKRHRGLMRERLRLSPDIRIVLLGARGSGKTSSMSTILSRESAQSERRTAQCQVGTGVVFGRQVTVVDTPGWWMNYFSDETPVFDRREMVLSLSLCPPGPHIFLLVIRMDRAFTETYRRAAQEHLQLIDQHIWGCVMVLFSFGDWLGGTTTEQCIESEGEPLRWLVERCGNRYHVLNNKTTGDGFQVRELIVKIEEMLAGCGHGQHCEIEGKVVEQLEGSRRREEMRAKDRLERKEKQRQKARSHLERLSSFSELRLVLLGGRKTGKSSCGNTILSRECFQTENQTTSCSEKQARISGKIVAVLDTPACFPVTSDFLVPSCAILLVVNGSSSFRETHMEFLETQMEAGGDQMWRKAVVLFSYGDWLGNTSIEQRIESEGEPLQRLVEKCGNRYHVLDNKHLGGGAQVKELIDLVEEMLAEERMVALHRGDCLMWKNVCSFGEQQPEAVTLCEEDLTSCRHQLAPELTQTAGSTTHASINKPDSGGHLMALSAGNSGGRARLNLLERDSFKSCLSMIISGRKSVRLTVDLPVWSPTDGLHLGLNGESQVHLLSSRRPKILLALPQTQLGMPTEENVLSVNSLCHPALWERTLRRLTESGGLQVLIDQWAHNSSLEELEAFIDDYFEQIWEQTMESCQPSEPEQDSSAEDTDSGQADVLSSINRRLSKLELLEEIRTDLGELRKSLEHSWRVTEELRAKCKEEESQSVERDESKMDKQTDTLMEESELCGLNVNSLQGFKEVIGMHVIFSLYFSQFFTPKHVMKSHMDFIVVTVAAKDLTHFSECLLCKYSLSLLLFLFISQCLVPRYIRVMCIKGSHVLQPAASPHRDSRGAEGESGGEHALKVDHVETETGRSLTVFPPLHWSVTAHLLRATTTLDVWFLSNKGVGW
ncbi:GTPase IMAP family member 8 [Xyrichtys novacula]|uniref:GTPase IMAP family member 8 n=1 Tax=Xyrichtys novacula TaxID=13765 RepID=A0AAV1GQZ2_XYRNO|nr:GTPase IMAP family member 8 [Xyrichtys novacula]